MLQKKLSNTLNSTPSGVIKKTASAPKVIAVGSAQALAIIVVVGAMSFWQRDDKVKVAIGTASIRAEVADSESERARGLQGKVHIAQNHGMLFVFPHDNRWGMWMKDMKIPIDIVWLDAAKKIVAVEPGADPASYPGHFTPPQNARYVLELASGVAAKAHIVPGIMAQFDVPPATK